MMKSKFYGGVNSGMDTEKWINTLRPFLAANRNNITDFGIILRINNATEIDNEGNPCNVIRMISTKTEEETKIFNEMFSDMCEVRMSQIAERKEVL